MTMGAQTPNTKITTNQATQPKLVGQQRLAARNYRTLQRSLNVMGQMWHKTKMPTFQRPTSMGGLGKRTFQAGICLVRMDMKQKGEKQPISLHRTNHIIVPST